MMKFYQTVMRCAPLLLFVAAVVSVFTGSVSALLFPDVYHQYGDNRLAIAGASLLAGFGRALVPFFGAALLWRIDRHWSPVTPEAIQ